MTRIVAICAMAYYVFILLEKVLLEKYCFIYLKKKKSSAKSKVNIFMYLEKPPLTFLKSPII